MWQPGVINSNCHYFWKKDGVMCKDECVCVVVVKGMSVGGSDGAMGLGGARGTYVWVCGGGGWGWGVCARLLCVNRKLI